MSEARDAPVASVTSTAGCFGSRTSTLRSQATRVLAGSSTATSDPTTAQEEPTWAAAHWRSTRLDGPGPVWIPGATRSVTLRSLISLGRELGASPYSRAG